MKPPRLSEILAATAEVWGLSVLDLLSQRRSAKYWHARHAFYLMARQTTIHSLPRIGEAIRRDHTSVMHGIKRAKTLLQDDERFKERFSRMKEIIGDVPRRNPAFMPRWRATRNGLLELR